MSVLDDLINKIQTTKIAEDPAYDAVRTLQEKLAGAGVETKANILDELVSKLSNDEVSEEKTASDPQQEAAPVNLPSAQGGSQASGQQGVEEPSPEEAYNGGYMDALSDISQQLSDSLNVAVQTAVQTVLNNAAKTVQPADDGSAKEAAAPVVVAPGMGLGRAMGMGIGRATGNYGAALIGALQNMAASTNDEVLKGKIADLISYLQSDSKSASDESEEIMQEYELRNAIATGIDKVAQDVAVMAKELAGAAIEDMLETKTASANNIVDILEDPELLDRLGDYTRAKVASDNEASDEDKQIVATVGSIVKEAASIPYFDYMVRSYMLSDLVPDEQQAEYWEGVVKQAEDIPVESDLITKVNNIANVIYS